MQQLKWLEFSLLKEYVEVFHSVFLRHGGVSYGKFSTLNVGSSVGDKPDNVKRNREIIKSKVGSNLFFVNQVHGTSIIEVKSGTVPQDADGMYTREKGIALTITHADCQAALFYDPDNRVIAAVHAGWRGLAKNIYGEMVKVLVEKFNTSLDKLIVCISPSLGPEHSEFRNYRKEFPVEFLDFMLRPSHFDLWEVAHSQLAEAGVKNIEIVKVCTYANPQDYFSYRRDKETGRHATVICLK